MKHFVFCTVFLVLFSGSNCIFDGLFNGCSFVGNNPASIHLYCNGSTETSKDDCTSIIGSGYLPPNVTELKISACDVKMTESLKDVASRILIGVRKLDISYNKHNPFVEYLLEESSSEHLGQLIASHCELADIPRDLDTRMPNLVEIDFSFNKINEIYPADLYKLKSLNLSSNEISTLDGFRNFISLESVDLSENPMSETSLRPFDECVNLKTLRIDKLKECSILRLMVERMVQVHFKYFVTLDTTCFNDPLEIESKNDELVVHNTKNGHSGRFTKNQLQNLTKAEFGPNQLKNTTKILEMFGPSITHLSIAGNFIGELTSNIFDRFEELEYLRLDRTNLTLSNFNPFENLSKLKYLNMSYNNLHHLNTTIFNKTLKNLFRLDVSYNGLKNIDEVIDCLSSKLMFLGVSGNPLREIKSNTFARFRNIMELEMDHTDLRSIDFNAFERCIILNSVSISGNNLTNANFTLPPKELSWLIQLSIDVNNLTELPGLNDASYPFLKFLNVTGNPMSCEYVTKLKEQLKELQVFESGDLCKRQETSYDRNILRHYNNAHSQNPMNDSSDSSKRQ